MSPGWSFDIRHPDQWAAHFAELAELPWYDVPSPGGYPHRVAVCTGEAENGRLVVSGLLIDPTANVEVTARLLRDIRIGDYLRRMARVESVLPVGRVKHSARHRVRTKHPGRAGYASDTYARFAAVYRDALRTHPRTPVRRTMTVTGLSESTVHERKQRCYELGLLETPARKKRQTRGRR